MKKNKFFILCFDGSRQIISMAAFVSIVLIRQFFEHENHSIMVCFHLPNLAHDSNCY